MTIEISTLYTKDLLLRYQNFITKKKIAFWCIILAANLLLLASETLLFVLTLDPLVYINTYSIIMVLMDLWILFVFFLLPRLTVKKWQSLGTTVIFSFEEESFHYHAANTGINETTSIDYNLLAKVYRNGDTLYLMNTKNTGYIVDISGCTAEEIQVLHERFRALGPKKCKWI